MEKRGKESYLSLALRVVGFIFIFGLLPLTQFWPSGWAWHDHGRSEYLEMIMGLYATLGVFLIIAAKHPRQHLSLIWFTVWSSIVHAAIMAVQSLVDLKHIGHLWGDVAALLIVAGLLAYLSPRSVDVLPPPEPT